MVTEQNFCFEPGYTGQEDIYNSIPMLFAGRSCSFQKSVPKTTELRLISLFYGMMIFPALNVLI